LELSLAFPYAFKYRRDNHQNLPLKPLEIEWNLPSWVLPRYSGHSQKEAGVCHAYRGKSCYQKRGSMGPIVIIASIIVGFVSAAKAFHWGAIMLLPVVAIISSAWWLPGLLDKLFPEDMEREEAPSRKP
tara:strand:+ start:2120 stop:2506 length:387 start_codon:yes stop_codon:yes gene_type:complete